MKLTYDPKHNIAYLQLHEKKGHVGTVRVSDELNVDIAPDGTVCGIELLTANSQLEAEDDGNLVVIDEAAGRRLEMPLAMHEGSVAYKTKKERESRFVPHSQTHTLRH